MSPLRLIGWTLLGSLAIIVACGALFALDITASMIFALFGMLHA